MHPLALVLLSLLGAGPTEYNRPLGAKTLDEATLDAERFGEKKSLKREDDGLRITLAPGDAETGWKTPQQLRIGGDFTITVNLVLRTLPKPAQEDGSAVGVSIAFQDINQPDVTLVRLKEPKGADVYRTIERAANNPQTQMQMQQMQMQQIRMGIVQQGAKPPKPPRPTFPAAGDVMRLELRREGNIVRYHVVDGSSPLPRYLGQSTLGTNDVAAFKVFASNRNGAEPVNVLVRDVAIRADRIQGLGTTIRTIYDQVVYGEPTGIEGNVLIVGGPAKSPPAQNPQAPGSKPAPATTRETPETKSAPPGAAKKAASPRAQRTEYQNTPFQITFVQDAPAIKSEVPTTVQPAAGKPVGNPPNQNANPSQQTAKPATPKARIPLDELESIRFERTAALAGRFLGQPNLDFTMPGLSSKKDESSKPEPQKPAHADDVLAPPPGTTVPTHVAIRKVEPKKNGIRDMQLSLSGLRNVAIKQITVTCPTDKGQANWRLDTTDSQDWPLVLRRAGTEPSANLFLEPPAGDCFQKDLTVNVMYQDNQAANLSIKATEHTDPKRIVDEKAQTNAPLNAWVYLIGGEKLSGTFEGIGDDTLRLVTSWQDHLDIPLLRVEGVRLGLDDPKESAESFAKRLKARGPEDILLAQTKNGEVLAISGVVEQTGEGKLHFRYQDKTRTLSLNQVEGLILAARPDPKAADELRTTFALEGGLNISGRWKDLDAEQWKVETAWGQDLKLPAKGVLELRFQGGKMTYLSDLSPSKVEEVPFFGRRLPWRRNTGLLGEPLKMDGRTIERGVAVHSRCTLTYDLNGHYALLETEVGFDDAGHGKGRVDCRVFADEKEIFANADLKAIDPPAKLRLPVAGAEQLRLVVDYGQGQDTGDRVIWANPRLYRQLPPTSEKTSDSASQSPNIVSAADAR